MPNNQNWILEFATHSAAKFKKVPCTIPLALPSSEKMRLNQRYKSAKIVFDEFSSGPHPPQKMTNTLKNKMAFDWVVKNDDDDDWCGGNLEGVLCPTQLEARPIC